MAGADSQFQASAEGEGAEDGAVDTMTMTRPGLLDLMWFELAAHAVVKVRAGVCAVDRSDCQISFRSLAEGEFPAVGICLEGSAEFLVRAIILIGIAWNQRKFDCGFDKVTGFEAVDAGRRRCPGRYVPRQWLKHEGHPGWQINTIDNILNRSLATSPVAPDLVTIHLGASVNTAA